MSEPVQVCLDDLSPLKAGKDVYGKYLICRNCFISYRVPGIFSEEDWRRIYEDENPPSEKELARRRVEAFLANRPKVSRGLEEGVVRSYHTVTGDYELLVSDLELLIKEED